MIVDVRMMKRLPNILTFGRIAVIPVIVALLFWPTQTARWLALLLFVVASISDFLDGWIARRFRAASPLGRLFDPIADKLLVGAVIVMLVWTGDAPVIPAIVIVCRELLVSGLREYLAEHRVALPVTRLAKWKTTVQMVALGFLLLGAGGPELGGGVTTLLVGQVLFWIAAALTLVTGWGYLRSGLRRPAVGDGDVRDPSSPAAGTP
jgi:CDP-diacylglycerol---glycerol-3-phosphate 3-phosphatidyltransferase